MNAPPPRLVIDNDAPLRLADAIQRASVALAIRSGPGPSEALASQAALELVAFEREAADRRYFRAQTGVLSRSGPKTSFAAPGDEEAADRARTL